MNSPESDQVIGFTARKVNGVPPSSPLRQTQASGFSSGLPQYGTGQADPSQQAASPTEATEPGEPQSELAQSELAQAELAPASSTEANLRQQLERERLINKIALQVFQSSDLAFILNTAVTEIQQFLRADWVLVERCYSNGDVIAVAEAVQSPWSACLGATLQAFWQQRSVAYHQGHKEVTDCLSGAVPPMQQAQARLALPILRDDVLWGVLSVHQCSQPRHWQPDDIHLLEQLTTQLSIAIHHSELHHEIQHLNDHLENEVQARILQLQQAYEFEATLKRITDRVRDSLDVDLILQAAIRELALVMKVRGCNASLYDLEEGTSTTCYEYTDFLSPYQGRIAKFSTTQELYSQLLRGECFQFCSLIPNPERGMVAALACPILDNQGVIGDLWVLHHKDHAFSEQDIRLVKQVANQCSIAIRQAHLYREVQDEVQALERLNQLKDDFLSTVSHELRTPLSNIKLAIHMLRTAPDSGRQQRYLQILEAECNRETELINDLLDLQRLENESYTVLPESIDLPDWLPTVLSPFVSRAQSRQQHLRVDLPPQPLAVSTDRKSLERILAELLNNACKYTSPDGSITLKVTQQLEADPRQFNLHWDRKQPVDITPVDITTFEISNEADIPADEIPRMFEKFYRIPQSDPWQQGGTGLGLALIKKLVEMLHGSIAADSRDGWTILTVHLPRLESQGE